MGNKVEVWVWVERASEQYEYQSVYSGRSLVMALGYMILWKIAGAGCMKLEWR